MESYSPWQNAAEATQKDDKNWFTQSVMGQLLGSGGRDPVNLSKQHLQVGR